MSAKEIWNSMFKNTEMSKSKIEENEITINYHLEQKVSGYQTCYGIVFNKTTKSYHTYCYGWDDKGKPFDNNWSIDIKLHKFINKQLEELGWLGSDSE